MYEGRAKGLCSNPLEVEHAKKSCLCYGSAQLNLGADFSTSLLVANVKCLFLECHQDMAAMENLSAFDCNKHFPIVGFVFSCLNLSLSFR